jgi:peptide deformylase
MEILTYPDKGLRVKAEPVTEVDQTLKDQLQQMLDLMYENKGVGLAGPQVGIPLRVLVMNVTSNPNKKQHEHIFINPVIRNRIGGRKVMEEGCLSLPGDWGRVSRSKRVTFQAYRPDGTEVNETWKGMAARCLQHEVDHLDGILFIDRMEDE